MKKIMFFSGNNQFGGAERVIINLANHMAEQYEVILLLYSQNEAAYEVNSNVKNVYLEDNIKKTKIRIKRIIGRIKSYVSIVEREHVDLIISFLLENNMYSSLVGKIKKIPTIISIRVDPKYECSSLGIKIMRRFFYSKATVMIFQTNESIERMGAWSRSKALVVDNPLTNELRNYSNLNIKRKEIVAVGRLTSQKNYQLLISAFGELHEEFPEYKMFIYGEGEERECLEQLIYRLGLKDRIFLPGNFKNIWDKISQAELFVSTSNYEGQSNALIEAMALGICCIATDVPNGGTRSIIENKKNGIIVPVNKREELISAIREMLLDGNKRIYYGEQAKKVRERFDESNVYSKWEKIVAYYLEK